MAIHKELIDNQFYLYMNGNLIYKRWLQTGESKVFDVMAYDKYTLTSYRDTDFHRVTPSFIIVKAKLKMKTTNDGGRETGFASGYRPNHVFEYKAYNTFSTNVGDIQFDEQQTIEPGEEKVVTVRFLGSMPIERYLTVGSRWWIHEGPNKLGEAMLLEVTLS